MDIPKIYGSIHQGNSKYMGDIMDKEASCIVSEAFAGDEAKLEIVTKRIAINSKSINKMKKIASLFNDELPTDAKEADMISFFLNISFESFLRSGEIEKRLKALTGDL